MKIKCNTAVGIVSSFLLTTWPETIYAVGNSYPEPSTVSFRLINDQFTGDWQQYGELFTYLASSVFGIVFLVLIVAIPAIFLLHYLIVGPKHFDHDGPQVLYFGVISRIVHWLTAISFSALTITGLLIIFGRYFGGGAVIMLCREIHLLAAISFICTAPMMLLLWARDMLPSWYDVKWMFILGGYLSKQKKPVPAGRFNGGQKMWFWLATAGGFVMGWSGYQLFVFSGPTDGLRIWAIVHNGLAAALIAFFLTHLYMSLFAIAGSLNSMISGYKPKDEVEILHSRYEIRENVL